MSDVTIYHNPRCSKSRQTLAILEEGGVTPNIVEYLHNPPDTQTLKSILTMLNLEPRELMRTKESVYAEKNLDNDALSAQELIQAMVDNPILIERPIVVKGNQAVVGRPPENVAALI
ncbi:MAG: arsenate reductase (glutaredoxin) [Pseudomonadales bacterium]|nr:arsenate reductase (glutaredoxin) [Pseudomonadales bacterium]